MQDIDPQICRQARLSRDPRFDGEFFTAVTTTPLICSFALKQGDPDDDGEKKDPYAGTIFQLYKKGLMQAIRFRWVTVGVVVVLFAASLVAQNLPLTTIRESTVGRRSRLPTRCPFPWPVANKNSATGGSAK